MTEYYTNKSDFEKGDNLGWGENNVQQVIDLLKDIKKATEIVKTNQVEDLYVAQGEGTLGKDMPESDFLDAEHKVLKIMRTLKEVHKEIVQNIENKYIGGLEDAMEALNKVNEGKNQYKSDHLSYKETTTKVVYNGTGGMVQQTTTETKHFTLSDILNSDKSPIPAAAAKYQEKLKVAKERLKELENSDRDTYNKLKDLSDRELMDTFYPTEMGEYKRMKSTFAKDNEQWLGWVETGVQVLGVALLVVGTVASGGTLAPVALAAGTGLIGGEALYRAAAGETISGEVLSTEQRWWAGAEAATTLLSGGLSTATKIAGKTASESLLAAERFAQMSANVYDTAQFGHDFMEDPQKALVGLATSQMIGRTIGHLGNKYKSYRASQAANVNIHSGEATSFKASIKDRVKTTWTDVKTKVGDVKVQTGEAFYNFKNHVSNVKNKTVAAGAEALSTKVRNFNDAMETGRQNVQNMMDSIGNQRQPAFALAGDGNVNLPKSNVSTKIDDFADRIQQISVDHKQKIAAFEGKGGESVSPKIDSEVSSGNGRSVYGPYYDEAVKRHAEKPDWYADPDESKIISGEELSDARLEYQQMVRRGELEPGHHRQGLAFGGENTPENIQFTGESTIRRSDLDGIDTSFYHENGYGKKDAKILKIHKNENGLYIFGNNPDHTEVTNFQNKVLRWQKNEGLR